MASPKESSPTWVRKAERSPRRAAATATLAGAPAGTLAKPGASASETPRCVEGRSIRLSPSVIRSTAMHVKYPGGGSINRAGGVRMPCERQQQRRPDHGRYPQRHLDPRPRAGSHGPDVLLWHYPNNDIVNGSLLTVESNHFCVLKSRGAILNVYETGQYPVDTPQSVLFGSIQQAFYGGQSPWQYEALYVNRAKLVVSASGLALSREMAEMTYDVDYYIHVDTPRRRRQAGPAHALQRPCPADRRSSTPTPGRSSSRRSTSSSRSRRWNRSTRRSTT